MSTAAGDVTTIGRTRAFFATLEQALHADVAQVEVALSTLAGMDLDEQTLDNFQTAQDDAARAAARCRSTIAFLDDRHRQLEEAVNATPDAARTDFYRDGTPASAVAAAVIAPPVSAPAKKERRMPRVNKHMSFCNGRHNKYQENCEEKIGTAPTDPEYDPVDVVVEASPGGEAMICIGGTPLDSAEAVDELIALLTRAKARHPEVQAELDDQCIECCYPTTDPARHCPQCFACHPTDPCQECAADAADTAA